MASMKTENPTTGLADRLASRKNFDCLDRCLVSRRRVRRRGIECGRVDLRLSRQRGEHERQRSGKRSCPRRMIFRSCVDGDIKPVRREHAPPPPLMPKVCTDARGFAPAPLSSSDLGDVLTSLLSDKQNRSRSFTVCIDHVLPRRSSERSHLHWRQLVYSTTRQVDHRHRRVRPYAVEFRHVSGNRPPFNSHQACLFIGLDAVTRQHWAD